jgi:rfaE bifunctional protein nucleotidyltransferase chain/domain
VSRPDGGAPRKVMPREEIALALEKERSAGRTAAFANGLFDLLHVGHVRFLEAASREADLLVVGVNSDASARKIKGPARPLIPASERVETVAALGCVDYVCVFEEPTAAETLRLLRPDVHCKGTDYTEQTVPERDVVLGYGGRIAITGDLKRHSTRDLIREIVLRFGEDS